MQDACDRIGEHWDTVQILCTRHDPGEGTTHAVCGTGNMFARIRHADEWVRRMEAVTDREIHLSVNSDEDDD